MTRLGIYGAGQLGAYLCKAAKTLGLHTTVLGTNPADTAVSLADDVVIAQRGDEQGMAALIAKSDVITFELEAVPAAELRVLNQAVADGIIKVAPSIDILVLLQNKRAQKQWLVNHGFPTVEFMDCPEGTSAATISARLGLPFIQKAYQGGYDGKGVQLVEGLEDDEGLWTGAAIAEKFVAQKRELGVLVARNGSGATAVYPVVEMSFDGPGHVLRHAVAPAPLLPQLTERAQRLARDVVERLGGVGLYAVEMFLTDDGDILINEIAPRVHNSGHLTLEAHATSQYEQHLRAILDLPLGSIEQVQPAAMVNLLQGEYSEPPAPTAPSIKSIQPNTHLYWYGKQGGPRLRKMGHVTCLGDDLQTALDGAYAATEKVAVYLGQAA